MARAKKKRGELVYRRKVMTFLLLHKVLVNLLMDGHHLPSASLLLPSQTGQLKTIEKILPRKEIDWGTFFLYTRTIKHCRCLSFLTKTNFYPSNSLHRVCVKGWSLDKNIYLCIYEEFVSVV